MHSAALVLPDCEWVDDPIKHELGSGTKLELVRTTRSTKAGEELTTFFDSDYVTSSFPLTLASPRLTNMRSRAGKPELV